MGGKYMSKMKVVLLSLLALLTASTATVATARASTHNFKIEGTELVGTEGVELYGKQNTLETTLGSAKVLIECQEAVGPTKGNVLEEKGKSKFELQLKNCSALEANGTGRPAFLTGCTVATITLKGTGELTGAEGQPADEVKGSEEKEGLGNLSLSGGSCTLAGSYPIRGHFAQEWEEVWSNIWQRWVWVEWYFPQFWVATAATNPQYGTFTGLQVKLQSVKKWGIA
jgi:hypothetical protein